MNQNSQKTDHWSKIAAPVPPELIQWRQDGKVVSRDGRHFSRFVCYVDAGFVRGRLDEVVPGEWDLTLELLPKTETEDAAYAFKARLQILGVIREDVGMGKDYKSAASDAFKRAAVRFGIGHELYAAEQNWVQMDGDGKYAKPVEDPAKAYERRWGKAIGLPRAEAAAPPAVQRTHGTRAVAQQDAYSEPQSGAKTETHPAVARTEERAAAAEEAVRTDDEPSCPKCGGRMWDNRQSKRNPKAPDFKCRDRSCDGVVWPPRAPAQERVGASTQRPGEPAPKPKAEQDQEDFPEALVDHEDDLPF